MAEKSKSEENKDKNKILTVIGVLVVAAAILIVLSFSKSTGSSQTENGQSDISQTPVEENGENLTSREWTWINTQMNDDSTTTPSTKGAFTLTFQEDGRVLATTDCNSGNGSYELGPDNSITFGPMATTMMFCEGSSEPEFYQQLSNVGSYVIQDGQLWLMLKFDSGTMVFE